MGRPESEPKPSVDRIAGDYATINFLQPVDMENFLNSHTGYQLIYDSTEDECPYPITYASITSQNNGDDQPIGLEASIEFDPRRLSREGQVKWQLNVLQGIQDRLENRGCEIVSLPHEEPYNIHVLVDHDYIARLSMSTNTSACHIDMALLPIQSLFDRLDRNNDSAHVITDHKNHYELLKEFTHIWSHGIDAVAEHYGTGTTEVSTFTIHPPEKSEALIYSTAPLALMALEAPIPSIHHPSEQLTSDKDTFRMLGGMEYAKARLQTIVDIFNDPVGAEMYKLRPFHFILHGPPGTGKTSLVLALANEIDADVQRISSDQVMDKWVGSSGLQLANIFSAHYAATKPIILFFDEFEALASKAGDSKSNVEVKKILNQRIDEITEKYPHIIIAAATNADIDDIEDSIVRGDRLEPISVPMPNEAERIDIWGSVLYQSIESFRENVNLGISRNNNLHETKKFVPYSDDIDIPLLAKNSDGMNGANFAHIIKIALQSCYKKYRETGTPTSIDQALLTTLISQYHQR